MITTPRNWAGASRMSDDCNTRDRQRRLARRICAAFLFALLFLGPAAALSVSAEPIHGLAYFGDLKYPKDFPHFDYANVNAPKGGRLTQAVIGTFNNLHPYVSKGIAAACVNVFCMLIYDTLMKGAGDELFSMYGNLAESVELADDFTWVAYTLREGAYWHDGVPITVEDVIWTFNTIKSEASLGWRSSYKDIVRIEQTGPRSFRFHFSEKAPRTPQLALHISSFILLPKHYWENRTFNATTLEPPLGSGPYRIKSVDPGRKIIYKRVADYWGRDLNVNIGHYNFDEIEYIYFLDKNVVIQAHKAHVFDYRDETNSKDWSTAYDFEGYRKGLFKRDMRRIQVPYGLFWGLFFNTRDPKLGDIRVREALTLAFDFEWENRVLFHDENQRNNSYFMGSKLVATGLPTDAERSLLEPYRDQLPDRVFSEAFALPVNSGYGRNRNALIRASALLDEAGWVVRDYRRVNAQTGDPFVLELLAKAVIEERIFVPFADSLRRLGIDSHVRRVESSQSTNRMRKYDFQVTLINYWQNDIPFSYLMRSRFWSKNADRHNMSNYAGISLPAVDFLTEEVISASSEEQLISAGRALDRILLWNFYMIPGGYPAGRRTVYWDRFGFPPESAGMKNTGYHHLWWFDAEKSARVDAGIAAMEE